MSDPFRPPAGRSVAVGALGAAWRAVFLVPTAGRIGDGYRRDHQGELANVGDVARRVALDEHQVGELAVEGR